MSHDADFAAFRQRREAERAAEVRVTWRRVSADTGGGYSGLGPNGRLVWVQRTEGGDFVYGPREGQIKTVMGNASTLARAKRAAAALFNDAATAAKGGTMESTTPNLTEALAEGIGEVAGTEKGSIRILANGHRLAYVNPRKDSLRLDISARDVEGAPARFQKMMGDTDKRGYRAMNVTAKNLKGARALMEWIAKQTA